MDLKELREILQLLDEKEISEFELEREGIKLRVRKAGAASSHHASSLGVNPLLSAGAPVLTSPTHPTLTPLPTPLPTPTSVVESDSGIVLVKSPIVGTFYRGPDPHAPPFVNVGDLVQAGQVLCIIEAMKLMNEIESEVTGEVVRIHHDNGQPVQYGEPLFAIRPNR